MLEFTLFISLLAGICFLVLIWSYLFRKQGIKKLVGAVMAMLSLVAMVCFYSVQMANGNPDQGMEFLQLYLPIAIYMGLILFGMIAFRAAKRN